MLIYYYYFHELVVSKVLHEIAGNAMHLRTIMVAIIAALKSIDLRKVDNFLNP